VNPEATLLSQRPSTAVISIVLPAAHRIESTVRHLGIEIDDALEIAKHMDVSASQGQSQTLCSFRGNTSIAAMSATGEVVAFDSGASLVRVLMLDLAYRRFTAIASTSPDVAQPATSSSRFSRR